MTIVHMNNAVLPTNLMDIRPCNTHERTWQMECNVSKFNLLPIMNKKKVPWLLTSVVLASGLCTVTAARFLTSQQCHGFLCRPLEPCSKEVKELAHISPVNSTLDYTSLLWGSRTKKGWTRTPPDQWMPKVCHLHLQHAVTAEQHSKSAHWGGTLYKVKYCYNNYTFL